MTFKKFIKKVLNKIYKKFNHSQRSKLATVSSKLLIDRNNSIKYDNILNSYLLMFRTIQLDFSSTPNFDFKYGDYANRMKELFLKNYSPKNGDVIIDLGAGIGTETYFYSKLVNDNGKVYAIEANPNSFSKLQSISKNNNLVNVSLHNIAIMEKEDVIWIEDNLMLNSNQINNNEKGFQIKGMTLDEFVKQNNIQKISLLKANIEGAEIQIIKGMNRSVDLIDNIAISCHDFIFEEYTEIKKTIVSFFEKHDFEITYNNTGNEIIDSWIYGKRNKK